jgi:lysophospholipase L1-like esterase
MRLIPDVRRLWLLGLALGAMSTALVAQEAKKAPTKEEAKKAQASSATEPAPREGGWMKMHESFLARTKDSQGVDLLFLGDSITQGWMGRNKEGQGPVEVWERYYGPRNAADFGIGGDRTQHVLWRIENGEVEGITPKVTVLMIGTNNLGANTNDEIAAGIEAIVAKLRDLLPDTRILLLGIFPRGEKPTSPDGQASSPRGRIKAINERIAKLDDLKEVTYLDIGPKFLEEDGTISKEIMPDFLHLSRKGYRIWADAMEPTLWSLLDEPEKDEQE